MPEHDAQQLWNDYCARELARLRPILAEQGFVLEDEQPHLAGERFLMQAETTTSGKKLILLGQHTQDRVRVVIKATSDPAGARELEHERTCRNLLRTISFAYDVFHTPDELFYAREGGLTITVQRFIEQSCTFLERPTAEQFTLALTAFKAQERAQVTTHRHIREVRSIVDLYDTRRYLKNVRAFMEESVVGTKQEEAGLRTDLERSCEQLRANEESIERYCGFLTHTDFVPHNIRVQNGTIYLLDASSVRFGNKHEGWARFLNFMTLYNPPLVGAFQQYTELNRAPEEATSVRLMRLYRLGEIIRYYVRAHERSQGNLRTLNRARITFWHDVLQSVLEDRPLTESTRQAYIQTRDVLRSTEEKKRQVSLH